MVKNNYEFLQVVNMCINNKEFLREYLRLKGKDSSQIWDCDFNAEYDEFKDFVCEFVYKPWKEVIVESDDKLCKLSSFLSMINIFPKISKTNFENKLVEFLSMSIFDEDMKITNNKVFFVFPSLENELFFVYTDNSGEYDALHFYYNSVEDFTSEEYEKIIDWIAGNHDKTSCRMRSYDFLIKDIYEKMRK